MTPQYQKFPIVNLTPPFETECQILLATHWLIAPFETEACLHHAGDTIYQGVKGEKSHLYITC
ncbi:hypothetical protein XBFFL1_2660037 [Xenorhabdus bovienii str. feltiae Florida]|nr:hypothetical protein XBFFR1_2300046 [Xenorhabdus bovienii str. feltiae France]CDG93712.1 hypothetical protein XBFFL1_2660037 [Xenorhabdus bovienii str. feltiae Florida]